MKIDPNAPAFPCSEDNDYRGGANGVTTRAWLAGQALAGLSVGHLDTTDTPKHLATHVVQIADAVIVALNADDSVCS